MRRNTESTRAGRGGRAAPARGDRRSGGDERGGRPAGSAGEPVAADDLRHGPGGQTLTTSNGTWSGTPTPFTYQWRRCDGDGGTARHQRRDREDVRAEEADVDNTIRSRVTARNADGGTQATSVPTAVVKAAPAPAPSGCYGSAPIRSRTRAAEPAPDRRAADQPGGRRRSTQTITVRFRVACKGSPCKARSCTAKPFRSTSSRPGGTAHRRRRLGDADDEPAAGFPATRPALRWSSPRPQGGEDILGGVSLVVSSPSRSTSELENNTAAGPAVSLRRALCRGSQGAAPAPDRSRRGDRPAEGRVRRRDGARRQGLQHRQGDEPAAGRAEALDGALQGDHVRALGLSRQERELLAVVVSRQNDCHY